jgi:hypothetical protein
MTVVVTVAPAPTVVVEVTEDVTVPPLTVFVEVT